MQVKADATVVAYCERNYCKVGMVTKIYLVWSERYFQGRNKYFSADVPTPAGSSVSIDYTEVTSILSQATQRGKIVWEGDESAMTNIRRGDQTARCMTASGTAPIAERPRRTGRLPTTERRGPR